MQTLDLYVKHRVSVDKLAGLCVKHISKSYLVIVLDRSYSVKNLCIVCVLCKVVKLDRIVTVARSNRFIKQSCKLRVRVAEPTTVSNTVCYVCEALGIHSVEVVEYRLYENIRVKLRNAVDAMASDYAKVSHANLTIAYNAHLGDLIPVSGEYVPSLAAEALIDFLNNTVDSGELQAEEILIPGFKRLRHYRVVGVRANLGNDFPRSIPLHEVLVNEYSHKLGDTERGVCVIYVDSNLVSKIIYSAVYRHMVADNALAGCRYHKVLLRETQKLSFNVVIGGVKNLRNCFCVGAFLNCSCILSLCKETHIEVSDISCLPQAKLAYRRAITARDHHIIRNCLDALCVIIDNLHVTVLPFLANVSAHLYLIYSVCSRNEPNLSAREPYIRKLYLHTVHDHLLEESVLIADRESRCGIIERCERVHKARCKSAQASISESCIRLAGIEILKIQSILLKYCAVLLIETEIAKICLERTTKQKFHAHIVNALCACCIYVMLEVVSL